MFQFVGGGIWQESCVCVLTGYIVHVRATTWKQVVTTNVILILSQAGQLPVNET